MPGLEERVQRLELLGVAVRLECDATLSDRLAVCYAPARRGEDGREPAGELQASLRRDGDRWVIAVDGREAQVVDASIDAVRTFNHELMHGIMLRSPELYFVHAGVVALPRRGAPDAGVVLPGLSQAGKSTLVLAMIETGARFLSDELLAYDPRAGVARAFPRAIKIRDECAAYFPAHAGRFVGSGEGRFLPFDALAADVIQHEAPIGAVVVPHWSGPHGETSLVSTRPGRAFLELSRSSLNFGTHREASLDCLQALVGGSSAWRLSWREPHEAARLLRTALENDA